MKPHFHGTYKEGGHIEKQSLLIRIGIPIRGLWGAAGHRAGPPQFVWRCEWSF